MSNLLFGWGFMTAQDHQALVQRYQAAEVAARNAHATAQRREQRIQELRTALQNTQAELPALTEARQQIKSLTEEQEQLKKGLAEAEKKYQHASAVLKEVNENRTRLGKRLAESRKKHDEDRKTLKQCINTAAVHASTAAKNKLSAELDALNTANDQLRKELETREASLRKLTSDRDALKSAILQERHSHFLSAKASDKELGEKDYAIRTLEEQQRFMMQDLKQELDGVRAQLKKAEQQFKEDRQQNGQLLFDKDCEIKSLRGDIQKIAFDEQRRRLLSDKIQITQEIALEDKNNEIRTLKERQTSLEADIKDLQDRLNSLAEKSASLECHLFDAEKHAQVQGRIIEEQDEEMAVLRKELGQTRQVGAQFVSRIAQLEAEVRVIEGFDHVSRSDGDAPSVSGVTTFIIQNDDEIPKLVMVKDDEIADSGDEEEEEESENDKQSTIETEDEDLEIISTGQAGDEESEKEGDAEQDGGDENDCVACGSDLDCDGFCENCDPCLCPDCGLGLDNDGFCKECYSFCCRSCGVPGYKPGYCKECQAYDAGHEQEEDNEEEVDGAGDYKAGDYKAEKLSVELLEAMEDMVKVGVAVPTD